MVVKKLVDLKLETETALRFKFQDGQHSPPDFSFGKVRKCVETLNFVRKLACLGLFHSQR
jgi:hypothetical protein